MSSRNAYLTKTQRPAALSLYQSLLNAKKLVQNKIIDAAHIIDESKKIITAHSETSIDYINICDPQILDDIPTIEPSGTYGPGCQGRANTLDRQHTADPLISSMFTRRKQ